MDEEVVAIVMQRNYNGYLCDNPTYLLGVQTTLRLGGRRSACNRGGCPKCRFWEEGVEDLACWCLREDELG